MTKPKVWALYKGEDLLSMGTVKEIAKDMDVDERTIHFYKTPTYLRRDKGNRRVLVSLEEEGAANEKEK